MQMQKPKKDPKLNIRNTIQNEGKSFRFKNVTLNVLERTNNINVLSKREKEVYSIFK